jgi:hypothetical protein
MAESISEGSSAHANKLRKIGTAVTSDPSGFTGKGATSSHGDDEDEGVRMIFEAASTSPSLR